MKVFRSLLFLVVSLVSLDNFVVAAVAKATVPKAPVAKTSVVSGEGLAKSEAQSSGKGPMIQALNQHQASQAKAKTSVVVKKAPVASKARVVSKAALAKSEKPSLDKGLKVKPSSQSRAQVAVIPESVQEEVPYLKELQKTSFSASQTQALSVAWAVLYELFKSSNTPSATDVVTPEQIVAMAPLFEMNCLAIMQEYLDPKMFPKLPNDPQSKLHINYATYHLRKAVARLGSVFAVDYNNGAPKTIFEGDNRDIGVIVNIQNNTKAQFSINQTSLDGKATSQVGQLNPGLNAVNLHTAALQTPATAKTINSITPSSYSFNFHEMDAENPTVIMVQMMSGVELVKFLRTLPRDKKALAKDTFEMNGLPTSPEYLAEPSDWYLVLIQNPTPSTSEHRNPDQRIQAVNVSKLTGPYLLTMQINDQDIEMKADDASTGSKRTVFQSSFTLVQIMQNQTMSALDIPLLILPQFLWELPMMQALWMLMSTTILATQTGGKFFGPNSFGDAFEYFKGLSCFNNQSRYTFFIDLYNIIPLGDITYDATWLLSAAVYETNLENCSDIPQIYSAQDSYGHIVTNVQFALYVNFVVTFMPEIQQLANQAFFERNGFNLIYSLPQFRLYTGVFSILKEDMNEGVFAELTKVYSGTYKLNWTNKKSEILNSQYLYLDASLSNIQISFVNQSTNWVGSSVPTQLIQLSSDSATHFKVTYEFNSSNNKNILLVQPSSPIDKQEFILPQYFSKYPITELYVDLYDTFNVKPYTRCFIIKDSVLPEPLMSLTEADWKTGIYFVPVVHNNHKIGPNNPGTLTIAFYNSEKTLLGEMTTSGQFNGTTETGIKEPVRAYNLHSAEFNPMRYLYLTTGVLLQYNETP